MGLMRKHSPSVVFRFLLSLSVTVLGGIVFTAIHTPIPWLLGPMVFMLLGSQVLKLPLMWPASVRDYGILIVGYSIGGNPHRGCVARNYAPASHDAAHDLTAHWILYINGLSRFEAYAI